MFRFQQQHKAYKGMEKYVPFKRANNNNNKTQKLFLKNV